MDNHIQTDFEYAYKYCEEVATSHYENFPVGSLLIPKKKRKFIYSIYAYARYADDISDSVKYSSIEKLNRLNEIEDELTKIENGYLDNLISGTKYIFIALYNTINELKIPVEQLRDLLTAFKQDAVKQSYETVEELLEYSHYSANPVGRMVLYIFGFNPKFDKKIFERSDKICTALQLTNFWQDVSVDLNMKRIYIPLETMKEYDYDENLLFQKIENDDFRKIIKSLVIKTKKMFNEGKEIINMLTGRLKLEIKAIIAGGEEILNKIESINYNVLSKRVDINNFDKLKLLRKVFF